ncbi:unnamed protein product [Sphagnum balticum]
MRVLEGKQITDEKDTGQRILRIERKVKRAGKTQGRNERGERDKRNNENNTKSVEKRTLQITKKQEVMNERIIHLNVPTIFSQRQGEMKALFSSCAPCIYP